MSATSCPTYLEPYLAASRKYGAGFGALLWASPRTQATRFKALLKAADVTGRVVLDAGCGRADLLQYMIDCRRSPRGYIGIEAVETLSLAAMYRKLPNSQIVRGDFVQQPSVLDAGADIVIYSGSLNTLDTEAFYTSITAAFHAASQAVVFNFLCSPFLAGAPHLTWHSTDDVMKFAGGLSRKVKLFDGYMRGDATVAIWKE